MGIRFSIWAAMASLKGFRLALFYLAIVIAVTAASPAFSAGLVILYPEVRKPYNKIYEDIITGIKESYTQRNVTIVVAKNEHPDFYKNNISQFDPDTIIALGKRSLAMLEQLNLGVPTIAGAITGTEHNLPGISIVPDPRIIIDKLLQLYGNARNVHIVTNTKRQPNQLNSAVSYGASRGINLIVHDVDTIQDAADRYRKVLVSINQNDAIWLMRDHALNDSALLSNVLEVAWKRKFAVFSSNPTHVKRGALFAIYPNNKKLGVSLGLMASNKEFLKVTPGVISPLQDVYTIVNGRTGRHLGLDMSREMLKDIDSIL
jgi:putative ABC transport system substrate-binding protein